MNLNDIAYHFVLTKHAEERLAERFGTVDRQTIKEALLKPYLAYENTDGSYNIAINEWEYFVVKYNEHEQPIVITFKEKSHNSINIHEKLQLALAGYERRSS